MAVARCFDFYVVKYPLFLPVFMYDYLWIMRLVVTVVTR